MNWENVSTTNKNTFLILSLFFSSSFLFHSLLLLKSFYFSKGLDISACMRIYIYICRERERDRDVCIYTYICVCLNISVVTHFCVKQKCIDSVEIKLVLENVFFPNHVFTSCIYCSFYGNKQEI